MLAEIGTDEIEGNRIDARIDVSQDEAENPECVPEMVVVVLWICIKVEPQKEDVHWQEADGKQDHKILQTFIHPINYKMHWTSIILALYTKYTCTILATLRRDFRFLFGCGNWSNRIGSFACVDVRYADARGIEMRIQKPERRSKYLRKSNGIVENK